MEHDLYASNFRDGYCLKCYEELNIAELQQLISLSK